LSVGSAPRATAELHDAITRLRAARDAQNITQASAAEALGVTPAAIAGWEHERNWPSSPNFILWARALGFEVVVTDDKGVKLVPARPVPKTKGEEPHHYRLRCLALTLRERRLDINLRQEDVAEPLRVSSWTVAQWEHSYRVPTLPGLVAWCHPVRCRLTLSSR